MKLFPKQAAVFEGGSGLGCMLGAYWMVFGWVGKGITNLRSQQMNNAMAFCRRWPFLKQSILWFIWQCIILGSLSSRNRNWLWLKRVIGRENIKAKKGSWRRWLWGSGLKAQVDSQPPTPLLRGISSFRPWPASPCPRLTFPGESPWCLSPREATFSNSPIKATQLQGSNSPKHSWSALPEGEGVDAGQAKTTEVQYISEHRILTLSSKKNGITK